MLDGATPLDLARRAGHGAIVRELERAPAERADRERREKVEAEKREYERAVRERRAT